MNSIERIHVLTFRFLRAPEWQLLVWVKHSGIRETVGSWELGRWFDPIGFHRYCFDQVAPALTEHVLKRVVWRDLKDFFVVQVKDHDDRAIGDLA